MTIEINTSLRLVIEAITIMVAQDRLLVQFVEQTPVAGNESEWENNPDNPHSIVREFKTGLEYEAYMAQNEAQFQEIVGYVTNLYQFQD